MVSSDTTWKFYPSVVDSRSRPPLLRARALSSLLPFGPQAPLFSGSLTFRLTTLGHLYPYPSPPPHCSREHNEAEQIQQFLFIFWPCHTACRISIF